MIFGKKTHAKLEPVATESERTLGSAVARRRNLDLTRAWWHNFLLVTESSAAKFQGHQERIGDEIVGASVARGLYKFDPFSGRLTFYDNDIVVVKPDQAFLYYTPTDKYGRKKEPQTLVLSGEKGIEQLLTNTSNNKRVGKGLHNIQNSDRLVRWSMRGVLLFGAWVIWTRIGPDAILGALFALLSGIRELLEM